MLDFPYFIYCIIFHKLNNSVNYICVQIALLNTNASNTNCTTNASTNLILLIIFANKLHNKLHYKILMLQIQIALQNTNASNANWTKMPQFIWASISTCAFPLWRRSSKNHKRQNGRNIIFLFCYIFIDISIDI